MKKKTKFGSAKTPSPWQVKGVMPETREAVKQAARRSGKTIGAWVNDALHQAAVEDITGKGSLPAKRLEDQLAELNDKIDALHRPFWQRLLGRKRN